VSYPDEWNHSDDPVETEEAIALRKCNALLLRAALCLSDKNVALEIVNEINRLQDMVEDRRQLLLIPPAP
jgi:hypothetical protein